MSARRLNPTPLLSPQRELSAQASKKAGIATAVLPITLVALALIGLAHLLGAVLSMSALHEYGSDFSAYFAAALALRAHPQANVYDLHVLAVVAQAHQAQVPTVPYLYPPTLAVLLIPLTILPYSAALTVWIIGNVALWLLATALIVGYLHGMLWNHGRVARDPTASRPATWRSLLRTDARLDLRALSSLAVGTFLSFTYAPIAQGVALGQITVLIFFIVALVPWLQQRGACRMAGVLLGVATVLKLFPAVLIVYFIARGQRRVVVSAIATIAALALLTALTTGLDGLAATRLLLTNGDANAQQFHNQSLARVPLWIGVMLGHAPQDTPAVIGYILVGVVAVSFALGLWQQRCAARKRHPERAAEAVAADDLLGYCWALTTMVLIAPITWLHYDAWLLPAIAACLGWALAAQISAADGRSRGFSWLVAGTIVAFALTMSALPFSYDGLTTFSPGPYIAGHAVRPYFMLLRPAGAAFVWLACGYAFVREGHRCADEATVNASPGAPTPMPSQELKVSARVLATTAFALLLSSLCVRLVTYAVALTAQR